ncbi:hypothetical protein NDU88_004325 [Pleurodeles waltl]|uniref:Uncharacterized protein n=1 Tax=Pleurodeles waltl TaxID=8319 RepID=A0AAV7T990_PLEWA|nr:hypothetical protein NDU88_004325 [Pleurodeles waltl]
MLFGVGTFREGGVLLEAASSPATRKREVHNKLRAGCPRHSIEDKVAATPEVDNTMVTFMRRMVKDPKRGIDRSWRACQEKSLDIIGPLTKITERAEDAKKRGAAIVPEILSGWTQWATCLLVNANCTISAELRRSLLLRLDPKIGELASAQAGPDPKENVFGDTFVKDLPKCVQAFTALDKAQASLKKVFNPRFLLGPDEVEVALPPVSCCKVIGNSKVLRDQTGQNKEKSHRSYPLRTNSKETTAINPSEEANPIQQQKKK